MQRASLADWSNVRHCEPKVEGLATVAGVTPSLYCYLRYEFSWVGTSQGSLELPVNC